MKADRRRFFQKSLSLLGASSVAVSPSQANAATWQRIGSGAALNNSKPNRVRAFSTSCGGYATMVLRTDGLVFGMGQSSSGAFGSNATRSTISAAIANLTGVKSVAMGALHALILMSDGTVKAIGENSLGQLGNNSTSDSSTPVSVLGLSNIVAVAASGSSTSDGHSLFLTASGEVWGCGCNTDGQLGDNSLTNRSSPVQMSFNPTDPPALAISAGLRHSLVLTAEGTAFASGFAGDGRLGNNKTNPSNEKKPTEASASNLVAVSAGAEHSLFLRADGLVFSAGVGATGRLGTNAVANRSSPTQMTVVSNVIAISAGFDHSVVIQSDGSIWSCGNNGTGVLGTADTTNRSSPVKMLFQSNIVAVNAGRTYSIMMDSDGLLYGVGDNGFYQLGDGTNKDRQTSNSVKFEWS